MDYEKKYKEALATARKLYNMRGDWTNLEIESIFPELRENEDERIRKDVISFVEQAIDAGYGIISKERKEEWIAWLENTQYATEHAKREGFQLGYKAGIEKLGEQKPDDKISLNFNKGDILYEQKTMSILLVYERNGSWLMTFCDYWMLKEKLHIEFPYEKYGFVREMSLVPATKEQRELLFQKIKEAGYEWDAEKKELKKIDNEEVNGENYGIDGLWHAQRILEKTLGEVEGYQSDDGILDHKAAITAVKKLYKQKPVDWSEEDENRINRLIAYFEDKESFTAEDDVVYANWLKSLKERVQPQPKQEWSEDDERYINIAVSAFSSPSLERLYHYNKVKSNDMINWLESLKERVQPRQEWSEEDDAKLKSILFHIEDVENKDVIDWLKYLRPQKQWKPSEEQMTYIQDAISKYNEFSNEYMGLVKLYNDLKKLKE